VTFPLHADGYCGPIDKRRLEKACFEVARRRMQGYLRVIDARGPKTSITMWECARSSEEDGRTAAESIKAWASFARCAAARPRRISHISKAAALGSASLHRQTPPSPVSRMATVILLTSACMISE
jgi:hypothetical protein